VEGFGEAGVLRYSCLIFGILLALLFLTLLITCRVTGLPISNNGWAPETPAESAASTHPPGRTVTWNR
jgi:hypothetical protein